MECDQINTFTGDRQDLHNPNLENIMAFTLGPEESEYIADTLSSARSLLDNVHCYDTQRISSTINLYVYHAWQLA